MIDGVLVDLLEGSHVLLLAESIFSPFICVLSNLFRFIYSRFSRSSFYSFSCCLICTLMNSPFASSSKDFKKDMFQFRFDISQLSSAFFSFSCSLYEAKFDSLRTIPFFSSCAIFNCCFRLSFIFCHLLLYFCAKFSQNTFIAVPSLALSSNSCYSASIWLCWQLSCARDDSFNCFTTAFRLASSLLSCLFSSYNSSKRVLLSLSASTITFICSSFSRRMTSTWESSYFYVWQGEGILTHDDALFSFSVSCSILLFLLAISSLNNCISSYSTCLLFSRRLFLRIKRYTSITNSPSRKDSLLLVPLGESKLMVERITLSYILTTMNISINASMQISNMGWLMAQWLDKGYDYKSIVAFLSFPLA